MNNISSMHCTRKGCKDVFHAFLVKNATYDSPLEIPCLKAETRTPKRLIAFSKAAHSTETDAWVHFYEDDIAFERLWNRPKTYLPVLQKFKGVISPDFSVYRDMPLVMQQWNIYRSRALAHWLQENGVINEGGQNKTPRPWNNDTGLNNNPIKRRKNNGSF